MSSVLAGDVGGTHTRLALFPAGGTEPAQSEVYPSAEHEGLEEMIGAFVAAHPAEPSAATFAVAGPVHRGKTDSVNLAWSVDVANVASKLGMNIGAVSLINDLEANAWGIESLVPTDLVALNDAAPEEGGAVAVISAGTGLGEAFITYGAGGARVHASEGGHVDFAARSEIEDELRRWLASSHEHVSYERVCSGMGLVNVYRFLRERSSAAEPDWLIHGRQEGDEGAAISKAGLERHDELASQALDLMISIYGAQAGNLALTVSAAGGVYLGGGIPPRILPRLRGGTFMSAFTAKGRLTPVLERIPVWVILNDRAALLGAARHASARLAEPAVHPTSD